MIEQARLGKWGRCFLAGVVVSVLTIASGCSQQQSEPQMERFTEAGPSIAGRRKADAALNAGNYNVAIEEYTKLLNSLELQPVAEADLRTRLGEAYWRRMLLDGGASSSDRDAAIHNAEKAFSILESDDVQAPGAMTSAVGRRLGGYYLGTGQYDDAISTFEKARTYLDGPGAEHVWLLRGLAGAYWGRSGGDGADADKAVSLAREGIQMSRQPGAEPPPLVLASLHTIVATAKMRAGETSAAADEYLLAEQLCAKAGDDTQHAAALANVIPALIEAGRLDEAKRKYETLQDIPGAKREPANLAALGMAALQLGAYSDAASYFDLAMYQAKQAPADKRDPAFQAQLANGAATAAQQMGAFDDAERYLKDALASLASAGRVDARTEAILHANLGRMYLTLERLEEAETELLKVQNMLRALPGAGPADSLRIDLDLANLAWLRGYEQEAASRYEDAVAKLTALIGADSILVANAQLELAPIYVAQGRCGEALMIARQAMAVLDNKLGANHKDAVKAVLRTAVVAANCQETQAGRDAFAELRRTASDRFRQLQSNLGAKNVEVLQAMVYFADVNSRIDVGQAQALERYEQAESGFSDLYGDEALSVAEIRLKRGQLLERMGRDNEAIRVYDEARRSLSDAYEWSPTRAKLLTAMGDLYNKRGAKDQAQQLWGEAYRVIRAAYGPDHPKVQSFKEDRQG